MVAARRLRPRRVEGPLAEIDSAPQLSIFEVDPGAVSTEPIVPVENEPTAPVWMRPERPAAVLKWRLRQKSPRKPNCWCLRVRRLSIWRRSIAACSPSSLTDH